MTVIYMWIALCSVGLPLAALLYIAARRDAAWAKTLPDRTRMIELRAQSLNRSARQRAFVQLIFLTVGISSLSPLPYAQYYGWLFVAAQASIVYMLIRDLHDRRRIRKA